MFNVVVEVVWVGSYGKGFVVVVEEVRNLVIRSVNVVKEISSFIEFIIKKIEVGDSIVK